VTDVSAPSAISMRAPGGLRATVEVARGREAFEVLREEWDATVARGPADTPFARHGWLAAWLDAFAPGATPLVLVARGHGGAALGMAVLLEERRCGVVRLVAPANDHSCRVEWALGADAGSAIAALWGHLRDRVAWDVLLLRDVARDGATSALLEPLARADGHPVGRWESLRSPRIPLGGTAAEERTSARFRANLRRRARRLAELGAVSVRRIDRPAEVAAALADFVALETSGWKGERGSAIALDGALIRFYARIARDAAERGGLAIRVLELDGRPVAIHLGLVHRGAYLLPKTAYDEALAHVSPGQLLQREVLAECEARGLALFEFLGPDMPWKRDWEPEHAVHDWLYVYRPSLAGRVRHALRHRLRPAVKGALAWRR
jgi:CelD/BcsL family acetyltransferase involved in cellulose biosynthesis